MARVPGSPDDALKAGRVDPKDRIVSDKPRRRKRRKPRGRPEPADELKASRPAARKRANARPYPPDIMLEPSGMDREHWTAPHDDEQLWFLQLADAFGTRSKSVIWVFLDQLHQLCGDNVWDEEAQQWRINEHELSAALAIVNGLKPRNELEAAHAAQMVGVHLLSMKVTARAIRYEYDTKTAAVAAKLAQVFTNQRDVFERLRRPNRTVKQSFKVRKEIHQYVQYNDNRGGGENRGQPHATGEGELRHARACEPQERPALPGPDEGDGEVVPFPGDAERALSPSRRAKSGRSER